MAVNSIPNQNIPNPEAAEAWACEQAVCLTRDLGFRCAIVEGDAQMVIRKMCTTDDKSEIRSIVSNVHETARVFDNLSFSFVRRSQNAAAHAIAKEGRSFQAQMVWIVEAPLEIEAVVARDRWWVDPPD
ncbi:hypothetical protein F3Y22_tig00110198pilonHSYRG00271 [Hibiscus syriacus]|uniref:RNase H type-1 domain-containing protein n=1 Tax=Hibiscus syriacus TaxID=106335 RepID=A0A6A3BH89_HIBSY|nr:hypothetical protein F3Y22_tig00110198pilonHSYRG00271 [Hibiscus syriacus]